MKHYIYVGTKEDMIYLEKELNKVESGVLDLQDCASGANIIYIDDDSFSILDNQEMNILHQNIDDDNLYVINSVDDAIRIIKE